MHGRAAGAGGTSSGLPAGEPTGHAAADQTGPRRVESEVQALRKEIHELRGEMDLLYRETRETREREAEKAQLFGLLGRIASRGSSREDAKEDQDRR